MAAKYSIVNNGRKRNHIFYSEWKLCTSQSETGDKKSTKKLWSEVSNVYCSDYLNRLETTHYLLLIDRVCSKFDYPVYLSSTLIYPYYRLITYVPVHQSPISIWYKRRRWPPIVVGDETILTFPLKVHSLELQFCIIFQVLQSEKN